MYQMVILWCMCHRLIIGPKKKGGGGKKDKWYFVTKIVLSDREKLLKFEAEGREFAKMLRSLKQSVPTLKGQNNFW